MPLPHRHRRMSEYYDSDEFRDRWHSAETVEDIAIDLDRAPSALYAAAKRRGFPPKREARPKDFRYKERTR